MLQLKLHNYIFSLTRRFLLRFIKMSFIQFDQFSKYKDITTSSNIYARAFFTKQITAKLLTILIKSFIIDIFTSEVFIVNPLSANHTKWSNTLNKFVGKLPTNCLSWFDHFVELELKGLILNALNKLLLMIFS